MTASSPQVGDLAPVFSLPATGGAMVRSPDLLGQPYLLYFYPKSDTPGCTMQACGVQETLPEFDALNLRVIGVSPDPVPRLERFATKYGLTFPLASDADHELAVAYGVWVEKTLYGRTYMGIERSSFLIDGAGVVRHIWRKVKPAEHAALVAAAAAALSPSEP